MKSWWHSVLVDLQQHSFVKGVIPTIGAVMLSFLEDIEIWLRIVTLVLGIILACITIYAKLVQIKKMKNE
jgi:hypothetical protein